MDDWIKFGLISAINKVFNSDDPLVVKDSISSFSELLTEFIKPSYFNSSTEAPIKSKEGP